MDSFLPFPQDEIDPLRFVASAFALGIPAMYLGRFVERTVGKKGMLTRIGVNAVVLYVVYALVPWSVTSQVTNSLVGALACAIFFNSQKW